MWDGNTLPQVKTKHSNTFIFRQMLWLTDMWSLIIPISLWTIVLLKTVALLLTPLPTSVCNYLHTYIQEFCMYIRKSICLGIVWEKRDLEEEPKFGCKDVRYTPKSHHRSEHFCVNMHSYLWHSHRLSRKLVSCPQPVRASWRDAVWWTSQISWAYSQNVVRTGPIANLVIIT